MGAGTRIVKGRSTVSGAPPLSQNLLTNWAVSFFVDKNHAAVNTIFASEMSVLACPSARHTFLLSTSVTNSLRHIHPPVKIMSRLVLR